MRFRRLVNGWCASLLTTATIAIVFLAAVPAAGQVTVAVAVPGYSDPWLAGMPDGSKASCWAPEGCDYAPDQSPQLAEGLCLYAGEFLNFQVTGGVLHYPGWPLTPPDGSSVTNHNWQNDLGENGISDIIAPYDSCIGVFLDDAQPDLTPEPDYLDFSTAASRDYLTLAPLLKQVFFIGDGLTSGGEAQYVQIPAGATRLFIGTMDSTTWLNNVGQFDVLVSEPCAPTATTAATWGTVKALYR
jgi:hypothetical protein